jgi:hypothetical protein
VTEAEHGGAQFDDRRSAAGAVTADVLDADPADLGSTGGRGGGDPSDRPPPARMTYRSTANKGAATITLIAILIATVAVVAVQLGPALVGLKTFSGVGLLDSMSPWNTGWELSYWANPYLGDTVDALLPGYVEIYNRLHSGDIPWWSTLSGSGTPLLSSPNLPSLTPTSVWLLLTPTWWAIGFSKLVQLVAAFGGMMLWLRRLGTTRAAGAFAGLVYIGSGFFVAWSGWLAQVSVAAIIPLFFWAVERFVIVRTARSALLISVMVAWMLLGGFPAVAGHALYAGGIYFVVRCLVEWRRFGARSSVFTVGGGAAAVLLGIGLSATQLIPMLSELADTDISWRDTQFDAEQPLRSLLTLGFPRIFNPTTTPGSGFLGSNPIEAYAFLGMGAIALAVLSVLAGRWHGISRGALPVLVVVLLLASALVWQHGFWTDWLRNLPIFSGSNSSRLRDLVGLAGSALAGIGLNLVFVSGLPGHVRRRLTVGSWVLVAGAVGTVVIVGVRYRDVVSRPLFLTDGGLGIAGVLLVAVAFTIALGRRSAAAAPGPSLAAPGPSLGDPDSTPTSEPASGENQPVGNAGPGAIDGGAATVDGQAPMPALRGRRRRSMGTVRSALLSLSLVALAVVGGAQLYFSTQYFWPLSDVDDFYPATPGITAAAADTGAGRALLGETFVGSSASAYGIRTLTGHAYQSVTWGNYLKSLDTKAYTGPGLSPTNPRVTFKMDDGSLSAKLLDRLSVNSVIVRPTETVPGPLHTVAAQPSTLSTPTGAPITVGPSGVTVAPLQPQNLRGLLVYVAQPAGDKQHGISITATVSDVTGAKVAQGQVIRPHYDPGWVTLPVAGEELASASGPLSIQLSVTSEQDPTGVHLALGAVDTAAGRTVDVRVIGSQPDGLRLAYADPSIVVWERPSALPRMRWATGSVVRDTLGSRLATLADPATPDSTVVLSAPGPTPSGQSADLTVLRDEGDIVQVQANAAGDGYLVLADSIQSDWAADIDGVPADLVDADHAFGAVFVPAGTHTVTFKYVGNHMTAGLLVTAISLLILVLVLVFSFVRGRRRRLRRAPSENRDMTGASV